MKLLETAQGVVLNVYVKPNAKVFNLKIEDNEIIVSCCEAPVKGKVNKELVKHFSRLFGHKVELISGFSSREKKFLVSDVNAEEVNQVITSMDYT